MNLRGIKKDIEYVLGAFIEDCSIFAAINPKASHDQISDLVDEGVDLYNELKDRVNAKPEADAKEHYLQIRKDLLEKTDALYTKLSDIVKAANDAPAEKPAKKASAKKKAPAKKEEAAPAEEAPAAE